MKLSELRKLVEETYHLDGDTEIVAYDCNHFQQYDINDYDYDYEDGKTKIEFLI